MINEQLLKTSGAEVLSSKKKLKKTSGGGGGGATSPPPTCKWRLKQNAFVFLWPDEEICLIYAHYDKTGNKYDGVLIASKRKQ